MTADERATDSRNGITGVAGSCRSVPATLDSRDIALLVRNSVRHPGGRELEEGVVKELRCRETGFECDAIIRGDTVDEVMARARPHAESVHGLRVTPDVYRQLTGRIRDA